MITSVLHFLAIVVSTGAAVLGVSRGHAYIAHAALTAMNRQPSVQAELRRSMLLALALVETAAVLGLLLSILLLRSSEPSLPVAIGQLGIAFAIGIPGLFLGWSLAGPIGEAILAIARQPFLTRRLTNFMLIVVSVLETAVIFGFVVALLIFYKLRSITTISQGLILMAAGIATGIGAIGPIIGGCHFTKSSFRGVGKNRTALAKLNTFTFVSQAIIETPIIFATVIAILLINQQAIIPFENPLIGFAYLIFGASIGISTFGAGISSGRTAAAAAQQISRNPQMASTLSRASMMAQGLIDTCAIYAFIIALLLTFKSLA
jgi:F-type H+-transporting ATPase subunit c